MQAQGNPEPFWVLSCPRQFAPLNRQRYSGEKIVSKEVSIIPHRKKEPQTSTSTFVTHSSPWNARHGLFGYEELRRDVHVSVSARDMLKNFRVPFAEILVS
jgi:hypothetical protein